MATASGAAVVAIGAACVVATGVRPSRGSFLLAAVAVVLGCFLVIRAAPWLTAINVSAAGAAVIGAAILKRRGGVFDLDLPRLAALAGRAVPDALVAGVRRVSGVRARVGDRVPGVAGVAVVRGVLLAVPVTGLLLTLLASADVVFAHVLRFDVPAAGVGGHLGALGAGASGALLLAAIAGHAPGSVERRRRPAARRSEAVVVLVWPTPFSACSRSPRSSRRSAVPTRSSAPPTSATPITLGAGSSSGTRALTLLSVTAVGLTLVVVAIAAQRMRLYEDAYGLTTLRLAVQWAILWIAVALALIGVALCRVRDRRRWLTGALASGGAMLLIAMNLSNPEAMVARVNIERAHGGAAIDLTYLAGLSADAAGTLADEPLTSSIAVGRWSRPSGILDWNLAGATAPR